MGQGPVIRLLQRPPGAAGSLSVGAPAEKADGLRNPVPRGLCLAHFSQLTAGEGVSEDEGHEGRGAPVTELVKPRAAHDSHLWRGGGVKLDAVPPLTVSPPFVPHASAGLTLPCSGGCQPLRVGRPRVNAVAVPADDLERGPEAFLGHFNWPGAQSLTGRAFGANGSDSVRLLR